MARLDDPERLQALQASGLLRKEVAERLDHLTYSAAILLRSDAAQVNALDGTHQHHMSIYPPVEPMPCADPVEHAGCREIVMSETTLPVSDTRLHAIMCDMPWTTAWRGYLGTPVRYQGQVIGSLCVLTEEPRDWNQWDLRALEGVARLVGMALDH